MKTKHIIFIILIFIIFAAGIFLFINKNTLLGFSPKYILSFCSKLNGTFFDSGYCLIKDRNENICKGAFPANPSLTQKYVSYSSSIEFINLCEAANLEALCVAKPNNEFEISCVTYQQCLNLHSKPTKFESKNYNICLYEFK